MYQSPFSARALGLSTLRHSATLSDDQIRRVAPSVFADAAHESRSERYAYIATAEVLRALRAEGFEPFAAAQSRTRVEGRKEHTKHLLRLRHMGQAAQALSVGESVPEIVLINSHDGSSSYQMSAGMFRLVCLNGLMVADSVVGVVRVPHSGQVTGIDQSVKLNRALWTLAEEMARLKAQH